MCVFAVPIGPASTTSWCAAMYAPLASSWSFGLLIPVSAAQSSWSKVLSSGKRASRSRRTAV
ncbi:hypothetical protein D3C83_231820 [compost metagenome]